MLSDGVGEMKCVVDAAWVAVSPCSVLWGLSDRCGCNLGKRSMLTLRVLGLSIPCPNVSASDVLRLTLSPCSASFGFSRELRATWL